MRNPMTKGGIRGLGGGTKRTIMRLTLPETLNANTGGNRAERYSNAPIIVGRPFTEEIDLFPIPPNFKMPPCESYDGTGDPMEHLERFTSRMNLHMVPDQIKCRVCPVILKGAAHVWFQHLAPRSISCWAQLAESFRSNFLTSRAQRKNSLALFRIIQGPKESLKSYYAGFNSKKLLIDHLDPGVTFAVMTRGVRPGTPLRFSPNKRPPENMSDLLDRVDKYLRAEEDSTTSHQEEIHSVQKRSEVCNVRLPECETRACDKLKETDLSETDLEHIEKLKGAEPLKSRYPLSNVQLQECGIIVSPKPQDLVYKEEEEGKNDPENMSSRAQGDPPLFNAQGFLGDITPDELALMHGAMTQVQIGVEKLIAADKVLDEEKKKVMIENKFCREAEKKVEDLSKKVKRLEMSNSGLTTKNADLSAHVNDLEAEKSSVALQAVQLFKRSKVFLDQRLRNSKGALLHGYNECKNNVSKDHPELDMSIYEHKFAREFIAEGERRAEEAERKKTASSRALASPSMSHILGASGSTSVAVLRPQLPLAEGCSQEMELPANVAE
ncbi:hypothetical protein RJ639_017165 [Escallonia herrerae]|uniref:Retrotransposon gag domain-containing protein n=1 Tax=Escallonia herrerae TaxID=1293975 RepID=A0AA89AIQ3_9ASTE|nr:hypothetical protein RJ639_017165 [Escallonia herrerae]